MPDNISDILDTSPALAQVSAWLPERAATAPDTIELSLGGEPMSLPFDAESIAAVLESTYRVCGFRGLEIIYNAAVASYAALLRGVEDVERWLTGPPTGRGTAGRTLGRDVEASAAVEAAIADSFAKHALAYDPSKATLDRLNHERSRRSEQMQALREEIDTLVAMEEEAQRWYEQKLFATIGIDFAKLQTDLEDSWRRYHIGYAETGLQVWLKDVGSADGLVILARDDQDTVTGGMPGPTVQGLGTEYLVHSVIKATHELAKAQFDFQAAIDQPRKAGLDKARRVDPASLPGAAYLATYRKLLDHLPGKYFIAHAAHRGLYKNSPDTIFNKETVEAAVIKAFLQARDTIPVILTDMRANLLFQDERPTAVIGTEVMARPAAESLIAAHYDERVIWVREDEPKSGATMHQSGQPKSEGKSTPNIFMSPWLQAPFHERLRQLAEVLRAEATEEEPAKAAGVLPKPTNSEIATEDPQITAESAQDRTRLAAEVAHLRPLFAAADDRMMLLWVTSLGTMAARARVEMMERLSERVSSQAEMRRSLQQVISGAGMVLAPFTEGGSIVVAGAIDAMLVADQATVDVERWIAAKQFSKVVLDQVAGVYWSEPEVSQLVGQLLEAGYEIASDLVQTGTIGTIFNAIGAAQLLLAVPDLAASLLNEGSQ
jgi:hypothetical protein